MIWPFRRRQPMHVGPTSVDWKPVDMAECTQANWPVAGGPMLGQRLMVAGVEYGPVTLGRDVGCNVFALRFVGFKAAWCSTCFRKIILTDTGADRTVGKRAPQHHRRKEDA